MKYNKPSVVVLGSAALAIQGGPGKISDLSINMSELQNVGDCELDD